MAVLGSARHPLRLLGMRAGVLTSVVAVSLLAATVALAATGDISTVAGTLGVAGSSGDGGLATSAELSGPEGLAVDSSGNIFIADRDNHVIRKVDASTGNISTVAGTLGVSGSTGDGGPATSAKLNTPVGIAVDSSGNIFIADVDNAVIRKVDASTGNISTVAGTLGVFGPTGDGGPATSAELGDPQGLVVDSSGNIFIADSGNLAIRKVDASTGNISTVAGILGSEGSTGDGGPATSAFLGESIGVAVDSSGNIFIADSGNQAIRKVDASTGNISTVAGTLGVSGSTGDGGPATSAKLNYPTRMALDSPGNVFIADLDNHAIRKVEGIAEPDPVPYAHNVRGASVWGLVALSAALVLLTFSGRVRRRIMRRSAVGD